MSMSTTALEGVLERLKGGRASRMQALVAAVAAGGGVYKLLRSGVEPSDEEAEVEGTKDEQGAE